MTSEFVIFSMVALVLTGVRLAGVANVAALLPTLAVFYYGVRQLLSSISTLGRQALRVAGLLPDVELLRRSLDEPYPDVRDGGAELSRDWQTIRFDGVEFEYPSRAVLALDGVSFAVERGRTLAIVGASGSGKTTIVNLLLRLFDPTGGTIRVDGRALTDFSRAAWLERVAYVSQENFVFDATVADNIRFGGEQPMEDVEAAARAAFAHDFIMALPRQYETVVGPHGMALSGGQRQRLAIARALLRQPDLLVLDEATSSLDTQSEQLIQRALFDLRQRCTQVVVAHRLSTIRDADLIVVLSNGRVVETGTHADLLSLRGAYAALHQRQALEGAEPQPAQQAISDGR